MVKSDGGTGGGPRGAAGQPLPTYNSYMLRGTGLWMELSTSFPVKPTFEPFHWLSSNFDERPGLVLH